MKSIVQRGPLLPHQLQICESEYPLLFVLVVESRSVSEREPQMGVVEILYGNLHLKFTVRYNILSVLRKSYNFYC